MTDDQRSSKRRYTQSHPLSLIQKNQAPDKLTFFTPRQLGRYRATSKYNMQTTTDNLIEEINKILIQPFIKGGNQQDFVDVLMSIIGPQQQAQQQDSMQQQTEQQDNMQLSQQQNQQRAASSKKIFKQINTFLAFLRRIIYKYSIEQKQLMVRKTRDMYGYLCVNILRYINDSVSMLPENKIHFIHTFIRENIIHVPWISFEFKVKKLIPLIDRNILIQYKAASSLFDYTIEIANKTNEYHITPEQLVDLAFSEPITQYEDDEFGDYKGFVKEMVDYAEKYGRAHASMGGGGGASRSTPKKK